MGKTYACNERCPSFHFSDIEGIGWCEDASNWSTKDICIVRYQPDDAEGQCED